MVSMGTVWDRATEFLSDNLSAIIPVALLAIFVPFSIWNSLAPLATGSSGSEKTILWGIILLLGIWASWGGLTITALAIDPYAGRGEATRVATRRLPWVLALSVLFFLLIALLAVPIPVALAMGGVDLTALAQGTKLDMPQGGVMSFVLLYLLAMVAAVLWLAARILLVNPVLVAEGRGFGAYARSFTLTRPIAWKVVGVMILYGVVAQVSEMATKLVFGSILRMLVDDDGQVTVATVLTSILVSLVQTMFAVLVAAFVAKLFLAVRDARGAIVESA